MKKRGGNRGNVVCVCVFFFPLAVSRQEAGAGEGGAAVISTVMWKWKLLSILHGGRAEELMLIFFFLFLCLCATVRLCARSRHIPVSHHHATRLISLGICRAFPYYYYFLPPPLSFLLLLLLM